jgi:hypothetical protein
VRVKRHWRVPRQPLHRTLHRRYTTQTGESHTDMLVVTCLTRCVVARLCPARRCSARHSPSGRTAVPPIPLAPRRRVHEVRIATGRLMHPRVYSSVGDLSTVCDSCCVVLQTRWVGLQFFGTAADRHLDMPKSVSYDLFRTAPQGYVRVYVLTVWMCSV